MEPYKVDHVGKNTDNSGERSGGDALGSSNNVQVANSGGDGLQEPSRTSTNPELETSTYSESRREQRPSHSAQLSGERESDSALRFSDRAAVHDSRAGKGGPFASTMNTIGEKLKGGTESMMGSLVGDAEIAARGRERQKVADEISSGANTAAGTGRKV